MVGISPEDDIKNHKYVFDEVLDMLTALKSKLIQQTKLTMTTATEGTNTEEELSEQEMEAVNNDTKKYETYRDKSTLTVTA